MEQIRNFDQLLQAALAHGRKGIAVAAPYDKNTLLAVKDALASGLAAPQLFGDVERMLPLLEQVQLDAGAVKLTDSLVQPLSMPEEVLTFSFSDVHAVPEGAVTFR